MSSYRQLAHRSVEIYRSEGVRQLLSSTVAFTRKHATRAYVRTVLSLLPETGPSEINGVAVPAAVRPPHVTGDEYLPFYPPSVRHWWHEEGVVRAHEETTDQGDDVVLVGGGFGVTAAHAARKSVSGSVTVYEADPSQAALLCETLALNDVPTEWLVHETAVGPAVFETYGSGDADGIEQLDAAELPSCDVLELDCEGSELAILEDLTIRPRAIIVEMHPYKGEFGAAAALDELDRLGYRITQRYTHSGAELTHDELVDKLHHRVRTEAEGLPPVVAAVRED